MTLSPYVVKEQHLSSQRDVWNLSAPFQLAKSDWQPASQEFDVLADSFGMSIDEVREILQVLERRTEDGNAQREQEISNLRAAIRHEKQRLERVRQARREAARSS